MPETQFQHRYRFWDRFCAQRRRWLSVQTLSTPPSIAQPTELLAILPCRSYTFSGIVGRSNTTDNGPVGAGGYQSINVARSFGRYYFFSRPFSVLGARRPIWTDIGRYRVSKPQSQRRSCDSSLSYCPPPLAYRLVPQMCEATRRPRLLLALWHMSP